MIFGKLICGHFDILMSQYVQGERKSCILGMYQNSVWLHTARNWYICGLATVTKAPVAFLAVAFLSFQFCDKKATLALSKRQP